MGVRIPITPDRLTEALVRRLSGVEEAIFKGMKAGAFYGQALLAHRTPRDTGYAASRWEVRVGRKSAKVPVSLINDAPYIGILEHGARPHPVSKEGVLSLAAWARRKFGVSPVEAMKIAEAIAWKIRHKGAKPRYFVRDSRDEISAQTGREIRQEIVKLSFNRNP